MAERIVYTIFGAFLVMAALAINANLPRAKADIEPTNTPPTKSLQPIKTESKFTEKIIEDTEELNFKTKYEDDPEIEAGVEEVLQEGIKGKKTIITKITYHEGLEFEREIVGSETAEPKDKIVSRGTKIIWKTMQIGENEIKYWKKIRVWATHYDHNCPGCNDWTATGTKAVKGAIAVDPKVIKMGTRMYVPGYGSGRAEDVGGAIKGNIIDLCFDDARTAGWSARFVDIYLLD